MVKRHLMSRLILNLIEAIRLKTEESDINIQQKRAIAKAKALF